ncbi:MAG: hypothetical protein ACLTC8_02050 [Lachnospiraceae bacterium]
MEMIMSMTMELDITAMKSFLESMILYPVDSIVELSNGEQARVWSKIFRTIFSVLWLSGLPAVTFTTLEKISIVPISSFFKQQGTAFAVPFYCVTSSLSKGCAVSGRNAS